MKKYLSFFVFAIAIIVSSCSNDDIAISKTVNFTVDPSTVVAGFSIAEENPGDLVRFDQTYKLNLQLLIYNEDGDLVKKFADSFSNYNVQMKSSTFLSPGRYTAVAISYLGSHWHIDQEDHLEGMRIVNAGLIGTKSKFLGAKVVEFDVYNEIADIPIQLSALGTVMVVRFYNSYRFFDGGFPNGIGLISNKKVESIEYDRSGTYHMIEESRNGSFFVTNVYVEPEKATTGVVYGYVYLLPTSNMSFTFYGDRDSETSVPIGSRGLLNIENGKCYYATLWADSNGYINSKFGQITSYDSGRISKLQPNMNMTLLNEQPAVEMSLFDNYGQTICIRDLVK